MLSRPSVLRGCALIVLLFLISGCATCDIRPPRAFQLHLDAFAFTNELAWVYPEGSNSDPGEKLRPRESPQPVEFYHRCFPMARAAREFFYHARFAPEEPRLETAEYRRRVRQVISKDSRCPSPPEKTILFPGYASLKEFSAAHAAVLQQECGGTWQSYLQRGNWRMTFPFTSGQTRRAASGLQEEIKRGRLPIVHVFTFPERTINHAVLLYGLDQTKTQTIFLAYDPNNPGRPAELRFDEQRGQFIFEKNHYFAGGPVKVYEVYKNLLY